MSYREVLRVHVLSGDVGKCRASGFMNCRIIEEVYIKVHGQYGYVVKYQEFMTCPVL